MSKEEVITHIEYLEHELNRISKQLDEDLSNREGLDDYLKILVDKISALDYYLETTIDEWEDRW